MRRSVPVVLPLLVLAGCAAFDAAFGAPVEVEGSIVFRDRAVLEGVRAREVRLVNRGSGTIEVRARGTGAGAPLLVEESLLPRQVLRFAPGEEAEIELLHPDRGRALVGLELLGDRERPVSYRGHFDPPAAVGPGAPAEPPEDGAPVEVPEGPEGPDGPNGTAGG